MTCTVIRSGQAEKQRNLSSLRISLLKACNGILAHVEEKYALSGLQVSFAKNERTA